MLRSPRLQQSSDGEVGLCEGWGIEGACRIICFVAESRKARRGSWGVSGP